MFKRLILTVVFLLAFATPAFALSPTQSAEQVFRTNHLGSYFMHITVNGRHALVSSYVPWSDIVESAISPAPDTAPTFIGSQDSVWYISINTGFDANNTIYVLWDDLHEYSEAGVLVSSDKFPSQTFTAPIALYYLGDTSLPEPSAPALTPYELQSLEKLDSLVTYQNVYLVVFGIVLSFGLAILFIKKYIFGVLSWGGRFKL